MCKFNWWRKKPPQPVVIEPVIEETVEPLVIKHLTLAPNPRYQGKLWGFRPESMIDKVIAHQELGEGTTVQVHNYHISKESHVKPGTGAPKICYHYTIEKDGTVYLVNDITDVVWHCKGQNLHAVGIMLCGDFDGEDHVGKSKPTPEQLASLSQLFDHLVGLLNITKREIYGHMDFGKPACPGYDVMKFIHKYKG
jgi:N-acetylmuramoyl-L-alanine amidase